MPQAPEATAQGISAYIFLFSHLSKDIFAWLMI